MFPHLLVSLLSDPNYDGTIATETPQRCLNDPDRSRVCNRSGSLARDLQNHGNTALAAGWCVSHAQVIGIHLDAFFSKVRIPSEELGTDTRVTYFEPWVVQGRTVDSQPERRGTRRAIRPNPTRHRDSRPRRSTTTQDSGISSRPADNERSRLRRDRRGLSGAQGMPLSLCPEMSGC